ncbi:MAG: peptidoglycan-binding protein [Synechococcales bacterium]|nr:peptidoglycan-binding protein [Synechococcales bacterium]
METFAYLHAALAFEDPHSPNPGFSSSVFAVYSSSISHCLARTAPLPLALVLVSLGFIGLTETALAENFILQPGQILASGDQGPQVRRLQRALQDIGLYEGSIDGRYGIQTELAVIAFQRSVGLNPDGIYGPNTEAALLSRNSTVSGATSVVADFYYDGTAGTRDLQQGNRGSDVMELQQRLRNERFYFGGIDGNFGTETSDAVRRFQRSRGLTVDGIVGPETWTALGVPVIESLASNTGISTGPYVVVIPADEDDSDKLQTARLEVSSARFARSRRGLYIFAGSFRERSGAETLSLRLRSRGLDSQVAYFRNNIEFFR